MVAKTAPRDHTSTASETGRPRITSGDLKAGCTHLLLEWEPFRHRGPKSQKERAIDETYLYAIGCMITPRSTSAAATAEPKSMSLTLRGFSLVTMMLLGLMLV